MKPGGLLQLLSVPEWKWDDIRMNFIVGLPLTACNLDSIWVIIDQLSKSAHFILIHTNYNVLKYVADLHSSRAMLGQSSKGDNLRLRFVVCHSLLRGIAHIPRNSLDPQFGLSPTDGWPN
jgi:hypothetical protein